MEFTKKDLNKTLWVKPTELENDRNWYVVDATGLTLGRLATRIAAKLIGKHKVHYNDFWDVGDYVVVLNAQKIHATGNKLEDKIYYNHSRWRGHMKKTTLGEMLEKHPERVIEHAVAGMLPKNRLRPSRLKRLKVFTQDTTIYNHLNLQQLS